MQGGVLGPSGLIWGHGPYNPRMGTGLQKGILIDAAILVAWIAGRMS